jgi:Mn2+/Fe2+ NRAMP family transporter
MQPDWSDVAAGIVVPRLPVSRDGMSWTLALMGGVGGTLTVLCYGYWIREQGRQGPEDLRLCRVDLGVAYAFTALFGMSIVIICTGLPLAQAGGERFMILLADTLGKILGPFARVMFLLGAWGAVFTSLLGVWQAVPYLFCDFWQIVRRSRSADAAPSAAVNTRSLPYRAYLLGIATIPMIGLWWSFKEVQKINAMFGALVMPMLALALLIMNSRSDWVGREYRNRPLTIAVLIAVLLFFAAAGVLTIMTGKSFVS